MGSESASGSFVLILGTILVRLRSGFVLELES